MPEAGDVLVLAPARPAHNNSSAHKMAATLNGRRHLKLNLNISQGHHNGGFAISSNSISGGLNNGSSRDGSSSSSRDSRGAISAPALGQSSSSSSLASSPCCPTTPRPTVLCLGLSAEEAHMSSKKSKLDLHCPLPFSTPESDLPGHPAHLNMCHNQQSHQLITQQAHTLFNISGNVIHPSENVHLKTSSSLSSSSSFNNNMLNNHITNNRFVSNQSHLQQQSINQNQTHNAIIISSSNTTKAAHPATSPTTAFINNTRASPTPSPVISGCVCGIACCAIPSCTDKPASSSITNAKLKSISCADIAYHLNKTRPVLLIDVRSANSYHRNHIQGAINLCLADRFNRRRIQTGKASVFDIIGMRDSALANAASPASKTPSPASKRKAPSASVSAAPSRPGMDIVVYDDHSSLEGITDPTAAGRNQDSALCTVVYSLLREGRDVLVLEGGIKSFALAHAAMCRSSFRPLESPRPLLYSPTNGVQEPEIETATADMVLPFLYLGNERDAKDLPRLRSLGISFVLNVTSHVPQFHDLQGIRYKRIPASDSGQQNLRQYFEEAIEYIDDARQSGARVLVHCHAGVSRSATVTIAYLLKHTRMAMADAYKFVKGKRAIISPNFNFMGQLLEFENDLNEGTTPRILHPRLQGIESSV